MVKKEQVLGPKIASESKQVPLFLVAYLMGERYYSLLAIRQIELTIVHSMLKLLTFTGK